MKCLLLPPVSFSSFRRLITPAIYLSNSLWGKISDRLGTSFSKSNRLVHNRTVTVTVCRANAQGPEKWVGFCVLCKRHLWELGGGQRQEGFVSKWCLQHLLSVTKGKCDFQGFAVLHERKYSDIMKSCLCQKIYLIKIKIPYLQAKEIVCMCAQIWQKEEIRRISYKHFKSDELLKSLKLPAHGTVEGILVSLETEFKKSCRTFLSCHKGARLRIFNL